MSLWAEIRHMHLADGVPKKEIARRLHLDIKTVRRALACERRTEKRQSPARGRRLDPFRGEIETLLRREPAITAHRIGRLLEERTGPITDRTVRKYVALLRRALQSPPAFVHRTHAPGETIEGDFGESWAVVGGRLRKVKFFVAALPCSNAYFSKSYPFERLECLLDGMEKSMRYFGGVPRRFVLDNTALAVKAVLAGRERRETDAFLAFRGAYALHVDFCAPAKGWEKGSVEGGVGFVRDNAFRPIPEVESFEELDARILAELEESLDRRKHSDGRSVRDALAAERLELRALPASLPQACRTLAVVTDKFGHVRVDGVQYSLPVEHAHRAAIAKLFHDRVEVVVDDSVVARHR
jgi:transposase